MGAFLSALGAFGQGFGQGGQATVAGQPMGPSPYGGNDPNQSPVPGIIPQAVAKLGNKALRRRYKPNAGMADPNSTAVPSYLSPADVSSDYDWDNGQ